MNLVRIRYGVMATGAQAQSSPADVLRFVETDVPVIGPRDALKVHCATVSPHVSPTLRGAAYIAALKGDPWRPQV